ncbi:glyoxalase [Microbacterium sp. MEC084]|jgi:catechol 2,3-dioxygenase-like lactoylglutathione lyase family enzyme|uniref:VOC family protein n=1 Tax=Microbacterium sp. MEC084 TaxID=1963027 RepID=UPI00106F888F|nr:VOC family protein [Microbacterium sp. MEC084]MCD1268940.1 glyoxalase [Microbacterium sp. MEC084]
MEQRISFITLVVDDVEASRAFYVDRLGWHEELHVEGEVLMLRVGDKLMLSLWDRAHAEAELGPVKADGVAPITLAHNVASESEVDAVIAEARAAGATLVSEPVRRSWGGYTGYIADPDGYRWEVAYNPGPIGESVLP